MFVRMRVLYKKYPDDYTVDDKVRIHRTEGFIAVSFILVKSKFLASFPLFHLHFRGLEEGPVLFLLALAFSLEGPPAVHASVPCFLKTQIGEEKQKQSSHYVFIPKVT